jgi:rRNA maturation protein Nop10
MIRRCTECGDFTLQEKHCGVEGESTRPPKFSFPDKYGEYRRKAKKEAE